MTTQLTKLFQRKELLEFQRGKIISAWKCDFSERNISDKLGYSKSTVHDVIVAYKNEFETLLPRTGKPLILIEKDSRHLIQTLNKNRRTNINELHENFVNSTSTNISQITIKRHLHEHNIYGRIGAKKPFVKEANKIKRLAQAKKRKDWMNE